jgi:hypothetical protein
MEKKKENDFIVRDHRISLSETSGNSKAPSAEQPEQEPSSAERATGSSAKQKRAEPFSQLDFSALVLTLATTAQVGLGSMPNPQTRQSELNLPAAKQMIDILGLLKDKTKGNLSQDEQALLDSALFNLRMQYVRAMEGKK